MARAVWLVVLLVWAVPTRAAPPAPYEEPFIQVHGFASPGFILTTPGTDYLAKSDGGSAEISEVGINFTKQITDELRFGLQLFARDLGDIGDYTARIDWFYLDYRFADWIGLRAGRVKIPMGLYNEIADVDAARVPVLLPQSIYPVRNRELLLAQTGAELYGYVPLGDGGALDYRVFGGTIYLPTSGESSVQNLRANVPFVAGGRLLWESPLPGLRLGASLIAGRIDYEGELPTSPPVPITARMNALMWVTSIELLEGPLSVAAEYGRWHLDLATDPPGLSPNREVISERAYVSFAYRVNDWFHPSVYYSLLFPDIAERSGRENQQHDIALTLRFDVNPHWLWKFEAHYMNGTAALDPGLNGRPRAELSKTWGVFILKTTAYF